MLRLPITAASSVLALAREDGPAARVDAVRLLTVSIGAVAALIGLFALVLLVALLRRRRRLRQLKADSNRRRRIDDAWQAAAERASTPSAAELEQDRLDLDDTRIPGDTDPNPDDDPKWGEDPPPPRRR